MDKKTELITHRKAQLAAMKEMISATKITLEKTQLELDRLKKRKEEIRLAEATVDMQLEAIMAEKEELFTRLSK